MFKYVAFDLDMTLTDSIPGLAVGINLLAEEFGLPAKTCEEVRAAERDCVGTSFEKLWSRLWGRFDPAWYAAYVDHLIEAEYAAVTLMPGGRDILEWLRGRGRPLGLASNRDFPRRLLKRMGIDHFFEVVVGLLDVEHPKPAPDMILKTLDHFGVDPDELLYVGDAVGDVRACQAAGVKMFGVSTGSRSRGELLELGVWRAGDSLQELLPLLTR